MAFRRSLAITLVGFQIALTHAWENIAGYAPGSQVTDHNAIDLDQQALELELKQTTIDYTAVKGIYENGGNSKAYAEFTVPALVSALTKGDAVVGASSSAQGSLYADYLAGETTIKVAYATSSIQATYVSCKAGSLKPAPAGITAAATQPYQLSTGCFTTGEALSVNKSGGPVVTINPTAGPTNKAGRTLQGFSSKAEGTMHKQGPGGGCAGASDRATDGCPYVDFTMYYNYYGDFDYANKLVLAAINGQATNFANPAGNMDFTGKGDSLRKEIIKKGTAYMNAYMYAIREFEDAIDDCKVGCTNGISGTQSGLDCNGLSTSAVHAWDEGVAFYTGSREGMVAGGSPDGVLSYRLAEKRCANFKTCGENHDSTFGISYVNTELFQLFGLGAQKILMGQCEDARPVLRKIVALGAIPLIQGTLRYAYKVDKTTGGDKEKEKGEGAIFAAAIVPRVAFCSTSDAAIIMDNMKIGATSTSFDAVKAAFENNYACMGITCAMVGGIWDASQNKYYDLADPCRTTPVHHDWGDIAGYMPGSKVTDHNAIDLDQLAIENALAQSTIDYTLVQALYQSGGNSKTYAEFSVPALTSALSKGDAVVGATSGAQGTLYSNYGQSETTIKVAYVTSSIQAAYVTCKVGALQPVPTGSLAAATQPYQLTSGCFAVGESLTVTTSGGSVVTIIPTAGPTNKAGRTLQGFSTKAGGTMYTTGPNGGCADASDRATDGCPYTDFSMYYDYYGDFSYADKLVLAAIKGEAVSFTKSAGNMDFTGKGDSLRKEIIKKGTAYMNAYMYAIREFEDAIDDCKAGCANGIVGSGANCNDLSTSAVHAWDEGVAFYTGSLEGSVTGGNSNGVLSYRLAEKRCANFKTCGEHHDSTSGTSYVNIEVFKLLAMGAEKILLGLCDSARPVLTQMVALMGIPLIQGTLRYAYKVEMTTGGDKEKEKGEGAIFAAAIVARVASCNPADATTIMNNMKIGASSTSLAAVKAAFENNYVCMGISCAEVGGIWDDAMGQYLSGAEPCSDAMVTQAYEHIAGYAPGSKVTDNNAIDLDQKAIENALAQSTIDYNLVESIYMNGGNSKSYAEFTVPSLTPALSKGDAVVGATSGAQGKLYSDYPAGVTSIKVAYATSVNQETYVSCKVGALMVAPSGTTASAIQPYQLTSGCFTPGESLTVTTSSGSVTITPTGGPTNKAGRTLQGFSTKAGGTMYTKGPNGGCDGASDRATDGCPYTDFSMYYNYYGDFDYADKLVLAAIRDQAVSFTKSAGNMDFTGKGDSLRKEIIKKGTAYMNAYMYAIREFEDAIDDCKAGCVNGISGTQAGLDCNGLSTSAVHAWDEGVAFYTGSLEGESAGGSSNGVLSYRLAEKRCANFKTCGAMHDSTSGTSYVNIEVFKWLAVGAQKILVGQCEDARPVLRRIVALMSIPLIQGTLRYAYKVDKTSGGDKEKEKAEGAIFAAAIVPRVAYCNAADAATIMNNMKIGASSTSLAAVKAAFESNYGCMSISCAEVGGIWDNAQNKYYDGAEPCGISVPNPSVTEAWGNIAGYVPGSQVTDHNAIDLDQKAIELALAQSTIDYNLVEGIYMNGGNSKSYAEFIVPSLTSALSKGDTVVGAISGAQGKLYSNYGQTDTTIKVAYSTSSIQATYVSCKVGALMVAPSGTTAAATEPYQLSSGCFDPGESLIVTTSSGAVITLNPTDGPTNKAGRTLQGFSTKAGGTMYTTGPNGGCADASDRATDGCPYTDFSMYYDYYGDFNYADKLVLAAIKGEAVSFTKSAGNMDFTGKVDSLRKEIIKKGTAYMNAYMYAIREFEDAIDDCKVGCTNGMLGMESGKDCNGLSTSSVHAWDEGVAFYTGSLEGATAGGSSNGVLSYRLAEKRCANFKTCGAMHDSTSGTSYVNIEVFKLLADGTQKLLLGQCEDVRPVLREMVALMGIPLIQGTLRYAYKVDKTSGGDKEKEKAEGAIFAAAIVPRVASCNATDAATIMNNMKIGASSTSFSAVKAAFENNYACMGITCAIVGGLWNSTGSNYYDGADPCGTPSTATQGIVTTSTAEDVSAGATTLKLTDVSQISAGMLLTISSGGNSETKSIVSVNPDSSRRLSSRPFVSGSVTLDGPLQYSYPQGASVVVSPQASAVATGEKDDSIPSWTIILIIIFGVTAFCMLVMSLFWMRRARTAEQKALMMSDDTVEEQPRRNTPPPDAIKDAVSIAIDEDAPNTIGHVNKDDFDVAIDEDSPNTIGQEYQPQGTSTPRTPF